MYTVLIIEDDEDIRQELKILLENALYQTAVLTDFNSIEQQVEEIKAAGADLILLDMNLPGINGMKLLRELRKAEDVPVIFVTARDNAMDEVNAMMAGGDDYITKPYQAPVLLAHISAVLKRTARGKNIEKETAVIRCLDCELNLHNSSISSQGCVVELSKTELKICRILFNHQGHIVSRVDMTEELWDSEIFIDDNTLSVNMTRLRNKLAEIGRKDLIVTKRGQGYMV